MIYVFSLENYSTYIYCKKNFDLFYLPEYFYFLSLCFYVKHFSSQTLIIINIDCNYFLFLKALISHEHNTNVIKETIVQENGKVLTDTDDGNHRSYGILSEYYDNKNSRPLRLRKKLYEFYTAPITKFWGNAVSFFVINYFFYKGKVYKFFPFYIL